jgi:hypothetical protein
MHENVTKAFDPDTRIPRIPAILEQRPKCIDEATELVRDPVGCCSSWDYRLLPVSLALPPISAAPPTSCAAGPTEQDGRAQESRAGFPQGQLHTPSGFRTSAIPSA